MSCAWTWCRLCEGHKDMPAILTALASDRRTISNTTRERSHLGQGAWMGFLSTGSALGLYHWNKYPRG